MVVTGASFPGLERVEAAHVVSLPHIIIIILRIYRALKCIARGVEYSPIFNPMNCACAVAVAWIRA